MRGGVWYGNERTEVCPDRAVALPYGVQRRGRHKAADDQPGGLALARRRRCKGRSRRLVAAGQRADRAKHAIVASPDLRTTRCSWFSLPTVPFLLCDWGRRPVVVSALLTEIDGLLRLDLGCGCDRRQSRGAHLRAHSRAYAPLSLASHRTSTHGRARSSGAPPVLAGYSRPEFAVDRNLNWLCCLWCFSVGTNQAI
jgi:hypothetical protein